MIDKIITRFFYGFLIGVTTIAAVAFCLGMPIKGEVIVLMGAFGFLIGLVHGVLYSLIEKLFNK